MPQPPATKPLGLPFVELQSVDSTNNYARSQIHAGLAQHGATFFAHEQLEGKGQRGKVWHSEKSSNIISTIIVHPHPLQLAQQFQLSACIISGVHDFFSKYAGDSTKIKWPNDLYWQDRKAGGILIENIVGQRVKNDEVPENGNRRKWTSIVGIGININQTEFDPSLKNPVSLRQITGKSFDSVVLAKELCGFIDRRFTTLMSDGFDSIFDHYVSNLYKRNESVNLKRGSRSFEAVIKGVSPEGRLMTWHAFEETFESGDVQWVF